MNRIIGLASVFMTSAKAGTNGTTFFIVGDYGNVNDINVANFVFDAIDKVAGESQPNTINAPEFFLAAGDNLYPAVADAPTV